jgi:transposase
MPGLQGSCGHPVRRSLMGWTSPRRHLRARVAVSVPGRTHRGREIGGLGHTMRLIPPAYFKLYGKRQKNDMADAEAICEVVQRLTMRLVPVKSEAQQANAVVFRARDLLVRQRTRCINAVC